MNNPVNMTFIYGEIPSGRESAKEALLVSIPDYENPSAEHYLTTAASLIGQFGAAPGNPCALKYAGFKDGRCFKIVNTVDPSAPSVGTPSLRSYRIQFG